MCRGGQQTMWDVHCQPGGGRIAYAGADGEVAVVRLERDLPNQPSIAIAGVCPPHVHIQHNIPFP